MKFNPSYARGVSSVHFILFLLAINMLELGYLEVFSCGCVVTLSR